MQAAEKYGDERAGGSDHWCASEFASLCPVVTGHFLDSIAGCEALQLWPLQFLCNLMSVIGKPSGGTRSVRKTPILYLVVALRWPCERLGSKNQSAWDMSTQGRTAYDGAALRQLNTEIAAVFGKIAG